MINEGVIMKSNNYGEFEIIEDYGRFCLIEFSETGFRSAVLKNNADNGRVKDKLHKSVRGVGCIGDGPYKASNKAYAVWNSMIARCYDPSSKSYQDYGALGVKVSEDWLNYQNFAEWYVKNNPSLSSDLFIDKDILSTSKMKVYSADTCMIVSRSDNNNNRGKPRNNTSGYKGVTFESGKWKARVTHDGKRMSLGVYKSPELAALAIESFKSKHNKSQPIRSVKQ